jgi:hypothetical protein
MKTYRYERGTGPCLAEERVVDSTGDEHIVAGRGKDIKEAIAQALAGKHEVVELSKR